MGQKLLADVKFLEQIRIHKHQEFQKCLSATVGVFQAFEISGKSSLQILHRISVKISQL